MEKKQRERERERERTKVTVTNKKRGSEKRTGGTGRFLANFRESETRRKKGRAGEGSEGAGQVRAAAAAIGGTYIAAMLSANTRVRPIYPKG